MRQDCAAYAPSIQSALARNPQDLSGTPCKSIWGQSPSANYQKWLASEPGGIRPEPIVKCLGPRPMHELPKVACLGTLWYLSGTWCKSAWGPEPGVKVPRPQYELLKVACLEPIGTRPEPVVKVPGARETSLITKSGLPRNPLQPVTEPV